jgi:hypothetical protein
MSKPSAPPAPDYAAAATAQGAANVDAARASSKLSNPNMANPYGTRTVNYGVNGDADQVQVTDALSPVGQQLFDQQNRISTGLGDLAEGGIDRVGGMLGSQFDMSQVADRPDLNGTLSRDAMTRSIIDRNAPMMDRRRAQEETQLSNQGIFRGSEAYNAAQDDLARQENDFNLGAIQQGGAEQSREYGLQSDARQNDIQTQSFLRQLPLNEINALRSGSQVSTPQFQQYSGVTAAPAPVFAGTQAQGQFDMNNYNQQTASSNALTSGLFGLAGAGAMGFAGSPTGSKAIKGIFSDVRLKENIRRIGMTDGGLPVYTYTYIGSDIPQMGVMAQEVEQVMPDAVHTHESGFKMVDYSKVQ